MITLFFSMGQGKKTYTQASINKMLELLSRFHNVHIKRRWVFQCLRYLEDAGYITRRKRYNRHAGGLIEQIPSLWSFTRKGAIYLVNQGVYKAKRLAKEILSHVMGGDGRFPTEKDFNASQDDPTGRKDSERLKQLAGGVTKDINKPRERKAPLYSPLNTQKD